MAQHPDSAILHFNRGKTFHEQGRFADAIECYQKAIASRPDFADAFCNLGLAQHSLRRNREALSSYERAIAIDPRLAVAHNNYGMALDEEDRFEEAIASFRQALRVKPDYAEAYSNLGAAYGRRQRYAEAAENFQRAIGLNPLLVTPYHNLANALIGLGKMEEAAACCQAALRLDPNNGRTETLLGLALLFRGRLAEALEHCRRAVQLMPTAAEAARNLGVALKESGQFADAIAHLRRAHQLNPKSAEILNELAAALKAQGALAAAEEACRRAIRARPDFAEAYANLGTVLSELGLIEEAISNIEKAVQLKPDYAAAHSARLFLLNYSARDAASIGALHRRWGDACAAEPALRRAQHRNDATPERRLRIGYVSPDFRQHAVGVFLRPMLARHDHQRFEVVCYSDVRKSDAVTRELQRHADRWRDVAGWSDQDVTSQISADQIDVLIDLAAHSAGNRMLVFARKPAPVQVTYLGYAGTTGLATVDYKLTDRYLDPVGATEAHHVESLVRLPACYFCYQPLPDCPDVLPPPIGAQTTFGAFQNLAKISSQTVQLWCQVLKAVPDSRLIIKARGLGEEPTQARIRAMFERHLNLGVRLELEDWSDTPDYLNRIGVLDVALDTLPFNGGTTTCHTLWMGVPVVTLAGRTALGRMGTSILSNVGLSQMIAHTPEEYVAIAQRLAGDPAVCRQLRFGLRAQMLASPLMDGTSFVANLERAYREMWIAWCAGNRPTNEPGE